MSRIRWMAGVAAVAASALGGCQPAPRPAPVTPGPTPPPSTDAPGAPRFGMISAICPALPADLPVVKILLTDVSPKNLGHVTALYAANKDGSASSEQKLKDIPEVVFKGQNPTRLDLDATDYLKAPGGAVLVEVTLADPDASFVEGPAALTAGNADAAAMFCLRDKDSAINPKAGDRTVRFYVRHLDAKTPRYGKFNIFLLLRDGPFLTPTVLDPKVHDSG